MAASGSGGEPVRPWTAASTWAPAGGGAVEDAVSFETSDYDAEASPSGVVLSRPPPDGDGDTPPCEVTVCFRGKYEIHRVYVRSTARIYEIYHSTDAKGTSKDYLCTVRCGLAINEPQPSGEESMAQWSSNASTSKKHEETKNVSSSSDEESWVDVKIPESPVGNDTSESQERNAVGTYQENALAHYEATAEMTDVSPCVSLTVRLLSLQSKASVHIEEIYIFADPVESTNDNSVTGRGNMGDSSLLAMLVPGLMQMSKSRSWKIDDRYFSHGSRTQLTQDCAIKESIPCENIALEAGSCSKDDSKYTPAGVESGINLTDGGTVSKEKSSQCDFQFKDPKSFPLPLQTAENTQVPSVKDQRVSNTDQLANPLMNEFSPPYNHIERKLDTLLSKVEKIELYCSRFDDSMMKPLGSIEARLQRLEQQFDLFSLEIQSFRGSSARMPAPDGQSDTTNSQEKAHNVGNARTTASITDRQPGLAVRAPDFSSEDSCGYNVTDRGLAVRAPYFSSEDSCCYNVSDENQVSFRGSNMVPRLLVKVPDFISQPELTGEKLHNGPFSPVAFALSSGKERKTSPGLVVKVPEFPDDDDDDDDEVEEEKEAEVGDHDDGHTQYDDTMAKSTADSSKSKIPVSINGALASALEALLTSTRGTSSSKSVVCTASNLGAENTNDSSSCSLSPEKVDEMSTKDVSANKFPGTFDNANLVGTFISSQEIDAAPHTSLSKAMLDGKVEVNKQSNDLNSGKVAFVASTEPLGVPSQPHAFEESIDDQSRVSGLNNGPNFGIVPFVASTGPFDPPTVFESVDSEAPVNESRPAVSLAEFLAARNAISCKNGTSEVCGGNDGAELLSLERTLAGAGKNSKNISQLLVKKALEVDADDTELFSSVPAVENFKGSSYATTGNAANGHDINTIETVSDKDCGPENTGNSVRLSVGMDSAFLQCSATDSKKKGIESSLGSSLDESFLKPNAEHSWSLSSMESFSGAPAKEPVVLATTTSGKYAEDLLAGIGVGSTVTPIAEEEFQKVCDLLYNYKANMLGMASTTKTTSKGSPSLEVLLGESFGSEAQISELGDIHNDAGMSSAQLFSTFTSSDDDAASAAEESLVDVADLTRPSEPYASALNEPLIDVACLTNPSGTYAPAVGEPSTDAFDPPNPSETYASGVNEPWANVDDLPKPLEIFAGGSSGEHLDSLI
ncbi:uncharacterized protein LOC133891769 [Phragmites australis]|uniref:uncharacterized protein LOC133891769 n=1 Tax=Phragmites australis TaxID=29695 RepID=UPI002D793468|nr:uncharacterized protein LOC133891769 [Phragmites australis]